ncbi:MAG TPA: alpha/beta hydrolase [Quisquiliibacterium sp.]|nr:alpha/beta hydrolase [Quisquiliibacterium sp.]
MRQLNTDLRGASRLAIAATLGVADLVEAMHRTISRVPLPLGKPVTGRTTGITGLVYGTVRGVTRLVGGGVDAALAAVTPLLPELEGSGDWPGRERLVCALNGVLGDYLERTGNPLAIPMSLRSGGLDLALDRAALSAAFPAASGRLLVAIHGLCMSDMQWTRGGVDRVGRLAGSLGATAVHLRYNTGLHVSSNGRAFAEQLEALLEAWPVPVTELILLGHSMGGLVARSAVHAARSDGLEWPRRLRSMVFLGTPHHGAPLERGGHWVEKVLGVSPYSAAFTRLGRVRSAGITDLRHGSMLEEDWKGQDRFAHGVDTRRPLPLPEGVACYAIAATLGRRDDPLARRLVGDGLVPLDSALGRHPERERRLAFHEEHTWVAFGTGHLDLLGCDRAFRRIGRWLAAPA